MKTTETITEVLAKIEAVISEFDVVQSTVHDGDALIVVVCEEDSYGPLASLEQTVEDFEHEVYLLGYDFEIEVDDINRAITIIPLMVNSPA